MNVRMPVSLYCRLNAIILSLLPKDVSIVIFLTPHTLNPFRTYWRNGQQPLPLGSSSSGGGADVEDEVGWGATTAVGRSTVELSCD